MQRMLRCLSEGTSMKTQGLTKIIKLKNTVTNVIVDEIFLTEPTGEVISVTCSCK